MCMDYEALPATRIAGTPFIGANSPYHAGPGGHLGAFIAWDARTGRKVWEIKERYPVWSGVLATGGGWGVFAARARWVPGVGARGGPRRPGGPGGSGGGRRPRAPKWPRRARAAPG